MGFSAWCYVAYFKLIYCTTFWKEASCLMNSDKLFHPLAFSKDVSKRSGKIHKNNFNFTDNSSDSIF